MTRSTPWLRRIPRLAWLLVGVVVLIGAAWLALVIMFPPERVRALVQRQLSDTFARDVRFQGAALGLWPPVRLTIKEPALAEPGGFDRGVAFGAGSVHLDLDALALLQRRFVVRRLVLEEPALHLVLNHDGTTNLDSLGAPAPERRRTPMDFAVSDLQVHGGQVLVDDLAAGRRIALGAESAMSFGLDAKRARITTRGKSRFHELAFGPLSAARSSDLNRSLAALEWKIEHDGAYDLGARRLALEKLALRLDDAELAFAGTADLNQGPPSLDLRARGSGIDLGQILGYLSAAEAHALKGVQGSGRLDFDLAVRGRVGGRNRLPLQGTLAVRNGALRYPGAPAGIEGLSFDCRIAPEALDIPDLTARVAGQPIRGSLGLENFSDPNVRFRMVGELELAAVSRLVADPDTRLAGRMALDVRGHGRAKDPGTLELEGWAKLREGSLESPGLPRKVEGIGGEFNFSTAVARITRLTARAGKSSFTLFAEARRPLALLAKQKSPAAGSPSGPAPFRVAPAEVDFSLASPYLDLAELLPVTPGSPLLPNARGRGRIAIGRLMNKKLDVTNAKASLEISPSVMRVSSFSCQAYGGRVQGEATIGLADPARPTIDLKAAVDSTKAEEVLTTWTGAGNIFHGALGGTIALSTRGTTAADIARSLTAEGLGQLANGVLGPAPLFEQVAAFTKIPAYREVRFRDFRVPFRIANGHVVTGPAKLTGSYGEWLISGAVSFEGALDYVVSITVPPEMVSRLGTAGAVAAGALADDQGRVLIDLLVTGNAKSPRVRWDERAMRDRLLGRVSSALLGQKKTLERQLGDTLDATRQAFEDSARARARQTQRALEDSLRNVGRDLLRQFFKKGKAAAPDTTKP